MDMKSLIAECVCSSQTETCYFRECDDCKWLLPGSFLFSELLCSQNVTVDDSVTWMTWKSVSVSLCALFTYNLKLILSSLYRRRGWVMPTTTRLQLQRSQCNVSAARFVICLRSSMSSGQSLLSTTTALVNSKGTLKRLKKKLVQMEQR
jgi:hypothetical protein